jgi:putative salt-induced outer membrane protein YdiY
MQQGDTDNKALNIQFNRTFTDGNTIKTWRAWAKFFNKYSSNAKYFTNIIAKERKS